MVLKEEELKLAWLLKIDVPVKVLVLIQPEILIIIVLVLIPNLIKGILWSVEHVRALV